MPTYAYVAHVVSEGSYTSITGDAYNARNEAEVIEAMLAQFARNAGVNAADLVVTDFSAIRTGD